MKFNVLQVGSSDLVASRFNGHLLHKSLLQSGYGSEHCVWDKLGTDGDTWEMSSFKYKSIIQHVADIMENRLSLDSLLYPFSYGLLFDRRFRSVDIVHYHLIQNRFFSITSLPFLTRMKPSVWTLHDPWAITGHCIYPFECLRWKTGCGSCPSLDSPFPMRKDRSGLMWNIKKIMYQLSQIEIIVASNWMQTMVLNSPLFSKCRVHKVSFGVNLQIFSPADQALAQRELGIIPGSIVVAFRAAQSPFKGMSYILDCLRRIRSKSPVCLLTFDTIGLVDEFRGRFQIVELGWINDEKLTAQALNACDIFLMPSLAEAFGLMAVEAMACAKPVVVFENTSLPEVVFAPQGGVAVPYCDVEALVGAVQRLIDDQDYREKLGSEARRLTCQYYNFNDHFRKILEIYVAVLNRRNHMT